MTQAALRTSDNPVESVCAFASVYVFVVYGEQRMELSSSSLLFCQEGGMTLYQECSAECGPMELFVGICGLRNTGILGPHCERALCGIKSWFHMLWVQLHKKKLYSPSLNGITNSSLRLLTGVVKPSVILFFS